MQTTKRPWTLVWNLPLFCGMLPLGPSITQCPMGGGCLTIPYPCSSQKCARPSLMSTRIMWWIHHSWGMGCHLLWHIREEVKLPPYMWCSFMSSTSTASVLQTVVPYTTGFYSVVLMALVDAGYKFIWADTDRRYGISIRRSNVGLQCIRAEGMCWRW